MGYHGPNKNMEESMVNRDEQSEIAVFENPNKIYIVKR